MNIKGGVTCLTLVASLFFSGAAATADTLEFKSKTCRKGNDKGCTAAGLSCAMAPKGKFITPGSFGGKGSVKSYWKKNPVCGASQPGRTVTLTHPDIGEYTQAVELCAPTHIESGSGFGDIGKVAFVNCAYSVTYKSIR